MKEVNPEIMWPRPTFKVFLLLKSIFFDPQVRFFIKTYKIYQQLLKLANKISISKAAFKKPCQASRMLLFKKIVNSFLSVNRCFEKLKLFLQKNTPSRHLPTQN